MNTICDPWAASSDHLPIGSSSFLTGASYKIVHACAIPIIEAETLALLKKYPGIAKLIDLSKRMPDKHLLEYIMATIEQVVWTDLNTPPANPDVALTSLTQNPAAAVTSLQALAAAQSPPLSLNGTPDPTTTLNSPPVNTAAPAPAAT